MNLYLFSSLTLKTYRLIVRKLNDFFSFLLKSQFNMCGKDFRCKPFVTHISYPQNIRIGDNFRSLGILYLYAEMGMISIGHGCSINSNVQLGAYHGEIFIGNNVLVGPNCVLRSSNHRYSAKNIPIKAQGHTVGRIIIEDDVWLGANVVVCSNVCIAQGCVIAAGSVVTRSTVPNMVYAGVPAKPIKKR